MLPYYTILYYTILPYYTIPYHIMGPGEAAQEAQVEGHLAPARREL